MILKKERKTESSEIESHYCLGQIEALDDRFSDWGGFPFHNRLGNADKGTFLLRKTKGIKEKSNSKKKLYRPGLVVL